MTANLILRTNFRQNLKIKPTLETSAGYNENDKTQECHGGL